MAGLLSKPLKFHMDYKVAWICALDIEMAAARLMLDATHDTLPQDSTDDNTYLLGEISGHNIVITCLPAGIYGTISAASVGVQVRTTYPAIRFGLMVGIGGGVPSKQADVRLGDVVVSKPSQTFSGVIQYDIGKSIVDDVFERVGALNSPPNVVLSAVSQLRARYLTGDGCISEIVSAILEMNPGMEQRFSRPKLEDELFQSTYKHSPGSTCANCDREYLAHRPARLSNDPQIHHGLVGSGNRVIKDGSVRDKIADDLGIICFEMEAAGLMNRIPTQVIRGICDYSDSHKNKHWQGYAALTAAAYAKELLTVIPISHASSTRSSSHTQIIAPHALSPLGQSAKKAHLVQIEQRKTMRCYELILGRLSIEISQDLSISATEKTTEKVKITILFPSWISNTLFHINVDKLSATTHPHSAPQLSIRPIYINQNARLRGAIGWCDIKELRTLFSTNQARPTDMIFDYETNEPVTLLEVRVNYAHSINEIYSLIRPFYVDL
jgi:nucleoside phosphorylase